MRNEFDRLLQRQRTPGRLMAGLVSRPGWEENCGLLAWGEVQDDVDPAVLLLSLSARVVGEAPRLAEACRGQAGALDADQPREAVPL